MSLTAINFTVTVLTPGKPRSSKVCNSLLVNSSVQKGMHKKKKKKRVVISGGSEWKAFKNISL